MSTTVYREETELSKTTRVGRYLDTFSRTNRGAFRPVGGQRAGGLGEEPGRVGADDDELGGARLGGVERFDPGGGAVVGGQDAQVVGEPGIRRTQEIPVVEPGEVFRNVVGRKAGKHLADPVPRRPRPPPGRA